MQFIKKKIMAIGTNGVEEVEAQVYEPGLAVHRDGALHWRITHINSGRAFYKKMSYRQAKRILKELLATGIDFSKDDDTVMAELAKVRTKGLQTS